jgi:hypothetical protein
VDDAAWIGYGNVGVDPVICEEQQAQAQSQIGAGALARGLKLGKLHVSPARGYDETVTIEHVIVFARVFGRNARSGLTVADPAWGVGGGGGQRTCVVRAGVRVPAWRRGCWRMMMMRRLCIFRCGVGWMRGKCR